MQIAFPAHISPNDPSVVQTCEEHSRNTAQHVAHTLESINLYSSAYLAGLVHDLGKYKSEFKAYLESQSTADWHMRRSRRASRSCP